MPSRSSDRRPESCPAWCANRHGLHLGEDDLVHVSAALSVRGTVLRLCSTGDPGMAAGAAPYVLMGTEEYTLFEADALIDALTQLVDEGRGSVLSQEGQGARPILDTQLVKYRGDVDAHRRG